ncbi:MULTISPECIES: MBL fold metallo-hydrolase [unclassified Acinetobacter]|uniref:MBL fold metallo-hydrolase n=1 Tax=unclassified Acinetobacter TaxID=196816 RepID=UPI00244BD7D0|nr:MULTISPECIES: MBL fold metallo-hydrolase [unclassified Acinetobacter]MDH0031118.1 MBL fold metallo-hydrolase [Acinetobacter sp. GD04021]MDH0886704.1 MBL fold metallo-hydrolase [Acinetobacter sp. GD03873]MDH1083163.1 MBL fold metallo-hydrolase [Acinetobacter sp. GD03983]MDH2189324.1 MBL fold metallo-hydrolase [Acinetobacter sp. GD03645]MDH2202869.1 MBL fold metallo-hydrolase [Acinetobacter sp. GD03647]
MKDKPTLTYQLPTQSCLSHTWGKPPFPHEASDHCGIDRFYNLDKPLTPFDRKGLLKWLTTRKSFTWNVDRSHESNLRNQMLELPQNRPHADLNDWQIWFVGHATILIQIGPYNFLTDPVWCEYVSPKQGRGPRRVCPAGIALEHLPTIHAVLLSHNHYDHMDLATLDWLHHKFEMPIYTGLGNGHYLPKHLHVIEMDWWQEIPFHDELKIAYTPAQHASGRGVRDQNRALWGGFSLLARTGHCFFAGDTGYAGHFKKIYERYGAARIALLPIGAYEPRQLMRYVHMNPQDAFHAHLDLHAHRSLAIHYRTFQLTDEDRDAPEHELMQAMKSSSKLVNPFYCIREGHFIRA